MQPRAWCHHCSRVAERTEVFRLPEFHDAIVVRVTCHGEKAKHVLDLPTCALPLARWIAGMIFFPRARIWPTWTARTVGHGDALLGRAVNARVGAEERGDGE